MRRSSKKGKREMNVLVIISLNNSRSHTFWAAGASKREVEGKESSCEP